MDKCTINIETTDDKKFIVEVHHEKATDNSPTNSPVETKMPTRERYVASNMDELYSILKEEYGDEGKDDKGSYDKGFNDEATGKKKK